MLQGERLISAKLFIRSDSCILMRSFTGRDSGALQQPHCCKRGAKVNMELQLCETNPSQAAQGCAEGRKTYFFFFLSSLLKLKLKLTLEAKFVSRPRGEL